MPHVIVKMYSGKSDKQKQQLADEIVKDFIQLFGYEEEALSVAIEDITPADWKGKVYDEEIMADQDKLFKKPGYTT
jgi:4-oxalocrotonate tautomerase